MKKFKNKNFTSKEVKKFNFKNLDIRLGYSLTKIRGNNILNVIDFLSKNKAKKIAQYAKKDLKNFTEISGTKYILIVFIKIYLYINNFYASFANLVLKMVKKI